MNEVGDPLVAILDYGMGNIRSVTRAAERVGAQVEVVSSPHRFDEVAFDGLVLPGQGHFGTCVDNLRASGLDRVVHEWCSADRPFLGICVGMQILVEGSDEGGSIGLGILPGRCVLVGAPGLSVPHMGWDQQVWPKGGRLLQGIGPSARFYYCHSYAIAPGSLGPGVFETVGEYGKPFVAALERSNLWAVQFHPEKSSRDGLRIWSGWVNHVADVAKEQSATAGGGDR